MTKGFGMNQSDEDIEYGAGLAFSDIAAGANATCRQVLYETTTNNPFVLSGYEKGTFFTKYKNADYDHNVNFGIEAGINGNYVTKSGVFMDAGVFARADYNHTYTQNNDDANLKFTPYFTTHVKNYETKYHLSFMPGLENQGEVTNSNYSGQLTVGASVGAGYHFKNDARIGVQGTVAQEMLCKKNTVFDVSATWQSGAFSLFDDDDATVSVTAGQVFNSKNNTQCLPNLKQNYVMATVGLKL